MDYLYQDQMKCNVKLLNKDLWNQFSELNTEMIITKPGRRMFPSMRVQVEDLDPHKDYCFLVEMVPASKCRYRYSSSTGWAPAGSEEAQSPNRIYVHPESPAPGHHWMSQAVSFGRLKLTNTTNPPRGHVVMSSMHKYQPRIIIVEASDVRMIHDYCPSAVASFTETQFIAVTAYQNDKMTKMKIDHNPFAKGFRETGQSKCKRKRQRMEQEKLERTQKVTNLLSELPLKLHSEAGDEEHDEEIIVDDLKKPCKRLSPSLEVPLILDSSLSSDSGMSDYERSPSASSTSPIPTLTHSPQPANRMLPSYNPYMSFAPAYGRPAYDIYHPYYFGYNQFYPYLNAIANSQKSNIVASVAQAHAEGEAASVAEDLSVPKEKSIGPNQPTEPARGKFTDFSIRAITGFA